MKVVPIGTKVVTKIGAVKGMITCIAIRGANGSYTSYEVSYFQNGTYTTCWLLEFEFDLDTSSKAGFMKTEESQNITLIANE